MKELEELLLKAIFMEMVDEDVKVRDAYAIRTIEIPEELRREVLGTLVNLRADEAHHSFRFLRKADMVDLQINFRELYERAFPNPEEPEGDLEDELTPILEAQLERERDAREFYRDAADRLRSSGGTDELAVARVFDEISRDEKNHVRRIKVLIDKAAEA